MTDVLAAIDEVTHSHDNGALAFDDLRDARGAVANLIEKVEELLSSHGAYHCYGGAGESIEEHMRNDLVLALARVKGGE